MAMPRRPPLNRGQSMPTYSSGSQSSSYGGGVDKTLNSLASLTLSESKSSTTGPRAGDSMRRGVTASSSDPSRPSTPMLSFSDARAHYPTPPHSAGPASGTYTQPSAYSTYSAPSMPRSKSHTAQSSSYTAHSGLYSAPSNPYSAQTSPYSTQPSSYMATPSYTPPAISPPVLRSRSSPSQQSSVPLHIESSSHQYTLLAPLGNGFSSDSITIAARKGNVIVVVADRWDQEQDCHHEWHVEFGRDADMSSIHAKFDNGVLKVTVRRLNYNIPS